MEKLPKKRLEELQKRTQPVSRDAARAKLEYVEADLMEARRALAEYEREIDECYEALEVINVLFDIKEGDKERKRTKPEITIARQIDELSLEVGYMKHQISNLERQYQEMQEQTQMLSAEEQTELTRLESMKALRDFMAKLPSDSRQIALVGYGGSFKPFDQIVGAYEKRTAQIQAEGRDSEALGDWKYLNPEDVKKEYQDDLTEIQSLIERYNNILKKVKSKQEPLAQKLGPEGIAVVENYLNHHLTELQAQEQAARKAIDDVSKWHVMASKDRRIKKANARRDQVRDRLRQERYEKRRRRRGK
jgi:hypothetical protein